MPYMSKTHFGKSILVNNNIISPVTQKGNVKIEARISVSRIVELYRKDFNIDVSTFFQGLTEIHIIKCQDSQYRFYYPGNIGGDNLFYEKLQEVKGQEGYYSNWRWEHEKVSKMINSNDRILDIGCGTGNFIDGIKSKCSNVIGLEFNNKAIDTATKRGIEVYKKDIHSFSEDAKNKGSFDLLCAFQVLEHIFNISDFINSCLRLLKKNGRLIIGVPNNNPYLYKFDFYHTLNMPPHHLGLWDMSSLKKIKNYFPMILQDIYVEPILDFNYWYNVQLKHLMKDDKLIIKLNRTLYLKKIIHYLSKHFQGRNLLAIYIKK